MIGENIDEELQYKLFWICNLDAISFIAHRAQKASTVQIPKTKSE
jgi:hypothetical protein